MATILYASATDHINKHPYDVYVQAHFSGIHPEVERGIFKTPIYEPMDPNAKQRSSITISKMVELFTSKSSFDIAKDQDVVAILHHIDSYVEEIYPMKDRDAAIQPYIDKIINLRGRIYLLFRRVMNLHPEWRKAYSGQVGVFQIIVDLYRPLGLKLDLPETLIEELRYCPTIRAAQRAESTKAMTSPGGFPMEQVIYDVQS